ncbi:MAG: hypothetical protein ABL921_01160 [Pirellula sp.]
MSNSLKRKNGSGFFSWAGQHAIAFFFCVGFPAFVTAIAPVSWLTLTRTDEGVHAKGRVCTQLFIPYSVHEVPVVEQVDNDFLRGERSRSRSRSTESTRSEDEGFLILSGREKSMKLSVSPVSMKRAKDRIVEFIAGGDAKTLTIPLVANWKFSVFAGGCISLLTVLYIVGITLSMLQFLGRCFGLLKPTPSKTRLGSETK